MKKSVLFILLFFSISLSYAQKPEDTEVWEPVPEVVNTTGDVPSDAIILFSESTGLSHWTNEKGGDPGWKVDDNSVTVAAGTGIIKTKEEFGSMQLHIEWRSPAKVEGDGQGRGNSGIFLMGMYEVQVLDSYNSRTYSNGQAGSIYKQHIPLANATRPPGEWQVYDIIFTAPTFDGAGVVKTPAYVTVIHNGVLIQNHVTLEGPTEYIGKASYRAHPAQLPLALQDHGNPVSYRNIWVRRL